MIIMISFIMYFIKLDNNNNNNTNLRSNGK